MNIPTPADVRHQQVQREAERAALALSLQRLREMANSGRLNNIRISDRKG